MLRLSCLASVLLALSATAEAQTPPASPAPGAPANPNEDQDNDVLLRAKLITEDQNAGTLIAEGDVEVRVGQRSLFADRLVWDQQKQTMRAQGRVQIEGVDGSIQFADEIEVDEDFQNGFATRFSVRLPHNAMATASAAIRTDGTRNTLEQVVYTGCPVCEDDKNGPTWSLRARRAVQNTETQMISYQDAVLEIKGVPLLYIPYFAHPDPSSERRSGLLTPDIGSNSALGGFVEVPYFLALTEYQDLVLSPLVTTNVNPVLKAEYRKRFFSGEVKGEGSITYESDFDNDGDRFGEEKWRGHLYGSGLFNINEDWKWGFGVETQSDDLYDRRYEIRGEDELRGLYSSQPRQLLNQVYATGQHPDFYFEAGLLNFHGLRAGETDEMLPRVAPSVFMEKFFDLGQAGQVAAAFSSVALFREEQAILPNGDPVMDTARATADVDWSAQYITGPGLVLKPFAQARADVYRVDDGGVEGAETISRVLGLGGAQISMPFIRRGENVDLMIEPIAMAAYGSKSANNNDLPNEDSLLFELDESNIFEPNAIAGYDLWEGGGRAVLGLNAKASFGNGFELSSMVGRRWREDADPAFSQLSNMGGEESDYVATARADFGQNFYVGTRMRLDDDFNLSRIDVDARGQLWRLNGAARYYRITSNSAGAEDEGILARGGLRLTDRFSAIFEQQRNITADRDIRLALGLAYRDECSYFAITYERSGARDRTLGPQDSIRFRFVLTGLGGKASEELF